MPSCKKMTDLLSENLENRLPLPKRWSMKLHLLICGTCRRYNRHLLFMQKLLQSRKSKLVLPETARRRILENLTGKNQE